MALAKIGIQHGYEFRIESYLLHSEAVKCMSPIPTVSQLNTFSVKIEEQDIEEFPACRTVWCEGCKLNIADPDTATASMTRSTQPLSLCSFQNQHDPWTFSPGRI